MGPGDVRGWDKTRERQERLRLREEWHTAVAGVHVCYQGRAAGVQVGNHFGLFSHIVKLGHTEVGHTEARSGCSGPSLNS